MIYLVFLGGVILGCIFTQIWIRRDTGYGKFTIEPFDDEDTGFYKVNVALKSGENLLNKSKIILHKDSSQK